MSDVAPSLTNNDIGLSDIELSIVIPALNEAATVAGVVLAHREVASQLADTFEMVVCDDGSDDGTWSALEGLSGSIPEIRLIRHPTNQGIPRTMKELYLAARGSWTYFTPADGQVPAVALRKMWSVREGAALVVGRRIPRRDPASRILMAQLYSALVRTLFGLPVKDIDSVKLYRSEALLRTGRSSDSTFLEAEILIDLVRSGAVVREIDIPHRQRIAGRARGVTALGAALAIKDVALFAVSKARRGGK